MNNFLTQKPWNYFLSTVIDYYFFIDTPTAELGAGEEYIIPFPRSTFGYFFDHPFAATNHDLNQTLSVEMAFSRISRHKISVQPQSSRVKILGAHIKPYALAYFTTTPIGQLSWLVDAEEVFQAKAVIFKRRVGQNLHPEQMFKELEAMFVETVLPRNLHVVTQVVALIEEHWGDIKLCDVATQVGVTERTLRNQFYHTMGCTPKEYIHLVKLRNSVYQMKYTDTSLTGITYDNEYFDQPHFTHSIKQITGRTPKELRKEIPNFRFLQF